MAGGTAAVSGLIGAPVDLRRGIDGLSAIKQQALGHAPGAGAAVVFRNRAGHRLKLLLWDGTGVWLCQRRLHEGRCVWPQGDERCCALSAAQWHWLVTGVDWRRLQAVPRTDWPV